MAPGKWLTAMLRHDEVGLLGRMPSAMLERRDTGLVLDLGADRETHEVLLAYPTGIFLSLVATPVLIQESTINF